MITEPATIISRLGLAVTNGNIPIELAIEATKETLSAAWTYCIEPEPMLLLLCVSEPEKAARVVSKIVRDSASLLPAVCKPAIDAAIATADVIDAWPKENRKRQTDAIVFRDEHERHRNICSDESRELIAIAKHGLASMEEIGQSAAELKESLNIFFRFAISLTSILYREHSDEGMWPQKHLAASIRNMAECPSIESVTRRVKP